MRLLLLALFVFATVLPATAQYELSLVADINPGDPYSSPAPITPYANKIFFAAHDIPNGRELWSYDPVTDEVELVADIKPGFNDSRPSGLTVYDDRLFFRAGDRTVGQELWVYDAVSGQTTVAADIFPDNSSWPSGFVVYDDRLFIAAENADFGRELWAYDASTGEAVLIDDINPGPADSSPLWLTVYDGKLFFQAFDSQGVSSLWTYNAATDEAMPIENSSVFDPKRLTVVGDRLFFSGRTDEYGEELWAYDSDSGESTLALDIFPGPSSSRPSRFEVYDGRLFFFAIDEQTDRLWSYDPEGGDAEPIDLVFDRSNYSSGSAVYDGGLFLRAFGNSDTGDELWMYDTSTQSATLVSDIWPGHLSSSPNHLMVHNGVMYFAAENGEFGRELWKLSPAPVTSEQSASPQPARLHTPHPNPTQGHATVNFDLDKAGPVRVEVLDVLGRRVALLTNGPVAAGEHALTWDAGALPSGLYLVRLTAGDAVQTQRLTLAR